MSNDELAGLLSGGRLSRVMYLLDETFRWGCWVHTYWNSDGELDIAIGTQSIKLKIYSGSVKRYEEGEL